eukprot:CAMPEP_0184685506 /NCGR_PEP_ID=MMETSP0312-20130426/19262_1 /TAXON_ID=31354 /ORGANISM="Compsopogon coeruleus, Strain SAG 36.94" /LENGTH=65 /DNA_ID=CAMNT_0027139679 /DNA_START=151 /DNA_END=348 /DNA_ORIENTATION=-
MRLAMRRKAEEQAQLRSVRVTKEMVEKSSILQASEPIQVKEQPTSTTLVRTSDTKREPNETSRPR